MASRKRTKAFLDYVGPFSVIFLLTFTFFIPIFTKQNPVSASGENWLAGWTYRKAITVDSYIEGYQTNITLYNVSGTYNCSGHANANFSDIRFTNSSGDGLIPYWIENHTADVSCDVWINNTYNESMLYLYYGNTTAANASSLSNTFDWSDDFEVGYDDGTWYQIPTDTPTMTYDTTYKKFGSYSLWLHADSTPSSERITVCHNTSFDGNMINSTGYRFIAWERVDLTSVEPARMLMATYERVTNTAPTYITFYSNDLRAYYGPTSYDYVKPINNNQWYKVEMKLDRVGARWSLLVDNVVEASWYTLFYSPQSYELGSMSFVTGDGSQGGDFWIDNVIVAKYTNQTEPTFTFSAQATQSSCPTSSVYMISPYEQTTSPLVVNTTYDNSPDQIALWYRWSVDNSSWDGGNSSMNNDTADTSGCDVDSSADIGNETNFANCQDISTDSDYMNIQENNTGSASGDDSLAVDYYSDTRGSWNHVYTDDSYYLHDVDYPDDYIYDSGPTADDGNWGFENTTITGNMDVNLTLYTYCEEDDDILVYVSTTGAGGSYNLADTISLNQQTWAYTEISLGSLTQTQANNTFFYVSYDKVGSKSLEARVDYAVLNVSGSASTNYELDFEYNWTDANFTESDEYICIEVDSHTGNDNLNVTYWDGDSWESLGIISSTGWNNFTATGLTSSVYTIRLNSTADSADTTQDDWDIDCIFLHTWNDTGGDLGWNWSFFSLNNTGDLENTSFTFPNSTGYYEFYSIANKSGCANETAPVSADAICNYTASGLTKHLVSSDINGTFTNTTVIYLVDSTINGTFTNTTTVQLVDATINGTFTNTTAIHIVTAVINGTFTNTTIKYLVSSDINGTFTNATSIHLLSDSVNGTFTNTTTIQLVDSSINGMFTNTSVKHLISNDKNGTFTNTTSIYLIDSSINGSFINTTSIHLLDDSINGTFKNITAKHLVISSINGTFTNASIKYLISNDKNGTFINTTSIHLLSGDINGSFVNTTTVQIVDVLINGTFVNTSVKHLVSASINGTFINATSIHLLDDTKNGTFVNATQSHVVTSDINGTFINTTIKQLITFDINGTFTNVSELIMYLVTDTINGTFTNTTIAHLVSSSVNGTFINTTTTHLVSNTINGTFRNYTAKVLISNDVNGTFINTTSINLVSSIVNGTFVNTTQVRIVSSIINGTFINTTIKYLISDSINGTFTNTTVLMMYLVDDTVNGTFTNTTSVQLVSSNINGTFTNATSAHLVTTTINGSFINATVKTLVSNIINGTFTNNTVKYLISNDKNGSFINTTHVCTVSTNINGSFVNTSLLAMYVVDSTKNGTFTNVTSVYIVSIDVNGTFTNGTSLHVVISSINGTFVNNTPKHLVSNIINGSFANLSTIIIISNVFPSNNSYLQQLQPTLYFTLTDVNGLTMNYSIYYGNSSENTTTLFETVSSVSNGTYHYNNYFSAVNYSTPYWWRVYANDSVNEINRTYTFTSTKTGGRIVSAGGGGALAIAAAGVMIGIVALVLVLYYFRRRDDYF